MKYKEVEIISEFIDAIRLRVDVFIIEQGFKPGWEPDEDDKISRHFIAMADDKVVATAKEFCFKNKLEIDERLRQVWHL